MNGFENKKTQKLVEAVLSLKTTAEAERFLRDLLTEPEIAEFGNRYRAAEMLTDKLPYTQIEKETGLSSTTIARVSKWLNAGGDGYKVVIARLNKKHHHHTPTRVGKGLSLRKKK
ncbi:MAG: YerC/YecD family TrpR-related protein [bacterium]